MWSSSAGDNAFIMLWATGAARRTAGLVESSLPCLRARGDRQPLV